METVSLIMQAVGSLGFPIVIALLAAWYIKYLGDKNRETVDAMQNRQDNQLDKMSDAITEVQKSIVALTTIIAQAIKGDEDDGR